MATPPYKNPLSVYHIDTIVKLKNNSFSLVAAHRQGAGAKGRCQVSGASEPLTPDTWHLTPSPHLPGKYVDSPCLG